MFPMNHVWKDLLLISKIRGQWFFEGCRLYILQYLAIKPLITFLLLIMYLTDTTGVSEKCPEVLYWSIDRDFSLLCSNWLCLFQSLIQSITWCFSIRFWKKNSLMLSLSSNSWLLKVSSSLLSGKSLGLYVINLTLWKGKIWLFIYWNLNSLFYLMI